MGNDTVDKARRAALWWPSLGILFGLLFVDQSTKAWVRARFHAPDPPPRGGIVVWTDRLAILYAENRGGSFALLLDAPDAVRWGFFLAISIGGAVGVLLVTRRIQRENVPLKLGMLTAAGGAIGNFIDRAHSGYVLDFIDVQLGRGLHWPTFNLADIAIVIGMLMSLLGATLLARSSPTARSA